MGVLVDLRGFQPDVLSDAHPRATGHAAPDLHLSTRHALVWSEHLREPQLDDSCRGISDIFCRCDPFGAWRHTGGRKSMGRADAGMGHGVATAWLQFPANSRGRRTKPAVGPARLS